MTRSHELGVLLFATLSGAIACTALEAPISESEIPLPLSQALMLPDLPAQRVTADIAEPELDELPVPAVDDQTLVTVAPTRLSTDAKVEGMMPSPKLTGLGPNLDETTKVLTINGTNANDILIVASAAAVGAPPSAGRPMIRVTLNGLSYLFVAAQVTQIVFHGRDGDDHFSNFTSIRCEVHGDNGNDSLNGGAGNDFLVGGLGQDSVRGADGDDLLWGSGGSDKLFGEAGDDLIKGHGGADTLQGGEGRDALYGGSGDDSLSGGDGPDVLVSIGGGLDTVAGGPQLDNFWSDVGDSLTDASPSEQLSGYVHQVNTFFGVSYDGGVTVTAIGKELDGANLPHPLPYPEHDGLFIKSFEAQPLFATNGPSKNDIRQGEVGDCYLMAPLSAIAEVEPEAIRKLVVDLGDGTYAVRFYRDGQPHYVRVDADLWASLSGKPKYARLGLEGSIWVPIVEKAYAFFRRQQGSYPSISGGDATQDDHLGATIFKWEITDGLDPQAVVDWVASGSPEGPIKAKVQTGALDLLRWMKQQAASGKALYTGARAGISDATLIQLDDPATEKNDSTYRRGKHVYMIDHVETAADGTPTALVLRDPYGSYPRLTDLTRIYFCIGRGIIWDM